jgi:luciferase family oxidoreductase group 1
MTETKAPPISILDLAPVAQGSSPGQALRNSRDLAQHAERWGYNRFWLAEHHNMIRIDLGLGRAPGTDQMTLRALRRAPENADNFPHDVLELQALLGPLQPGQMVQAVPGTGLNIPLWILGSSTFGAQLAAALGLPYAFASHFAPEALMQALQVYRVKFEPSEQQARPYAMVGVNVVAAETDEEARRLFTSAQQAFTNLLRGTRGQLRPPIDDIEAYWTAPEKARASAMLSCSFVGSRQTVRNGLEEFIARTGADELMVASAIYDHSARLRSYEILAEVRNSLGVEAALA